MGVYGLFMCLVCRLCFVKCYKVVGLMVGLCKVLCCLSLRCTFMRYYDCWGVDFGWVVCLVVWVCVFVLSLRSVGLFWVIRLGLLLWVICLWCYWVFVCFRFCGWVGCVFVWVGLMISLFCFVWVDGLFEVWGLGG